jgi:quercetin dioxygenase-like cupin family protein
MRFRFSSRLFVRGEAVPLHSHASAEAFCVLTGTIEFFRVVAGEQDRICCETGALMIVPPNALHALRNNTSQRGRLLGISTHLHRHSLMRSSRPTRGERSRLFRCLRC